MCVDVCKECVDVDVHVCGCACVWMCVRNVCGCAYRHVC